MVTIAGAVIGAIITCALSLVGSYFMIRYQFAQQKKHEVIKTFIDEANFLYTVFERLLTLTKEGKADSSEFQESVSCVSDRAYDLRKYVFIIRDNQHITQTQKETAEEIYSNFAQIINKQGDITQYMVNIRAGLSKLNY